MDTREQIEVTIRIAQLGKVVMQLVGVKDKTLAKMHMAGIVEQLTALDEFLDSTEV